MTDTPGERPEDHYLEQELAALIQSDPRIFAFLESGSLDGLWYWDLEKTEHEWMSPRFWTTFGYDPASKAHLAAEWQDIINTDDLKLAIENFKKHSADPSHPYDQIVRYQHKDGSTVWVRCRGLIIRDDDGKPVRMLGAHTNVTEIQNARAELEQFGSIVSHDLRAPLRGIRQLVEIITDEFEDRIDDDTRPLFEMLINRVNTLDNLIHSLLRFSRVGKVAFEYTTVDSGELVANVVDLLSPPSNITVSVADDLPTLTTDPAPLSQVFMNLIGNAIKHHDKDEGLVQITVKDMGDWYEFTVKDDGPGIPDRYRERIFLPFQRLKSTDNNTSGLGLTIVKKLLGLFGGEIGIRDESDVGTTFHFTWPKTPPSD